MMGGGGAQKTGMFSPGGAAVGGQGSGGGKPAMMQGKTMNSSRIGDIDLAASLASTINAKNGGGGGNGGGAPRGPYNPQQGADHFDFVKSSMGRR